MDPIKKPAVDLEKSNTIIKIKLSDMLGASHKPLEDPIYSDSDSAPLEEEEELDEPEEVPNENSASPEEEELSSLRSSGFPAEEESPSINSQTNAKDQEPSSNDAKAISEMGGMSNNDEVLDKSPVKTEVDGEKRENEKNDNFSEIKEKVNPILDPSLDPQSQQGNYWKYRKPPKQKHNNVLMDYTNLRMDQTEIFQVSLERASNFNDYILTNRKKIKEITKTLERQKLNQRFALDNSNSIFPSLLIPLIRQDDEMGPDPIYESNGCLELEKDSLQKFIELNVNNEHSTFEHPSKFAMFYPRRFQRRRRRRRNASKFMNNEGGGDGIPDSGNKLD